MTQRDKPIRISGEQYDYLDELKVEIYGTKNASFKEVVATLIEEHENNGG